MSQTDTYRPAILPSEAVMLPATEVPDTPLPAAQNEPNPNDPTMRPAQRSHASYQLEEVRSRARRFETQGVQWYNTNQMPLDNRGASHPPAGRQMMAESAETPPMPRVTTTQGAALSSLMRSAARQYTPAPTLNGPPMMPAEPYMSQPPAQPQMRGALRSVVRQAQQSGTMRQGMPNRPY